jgi:hypothetical protein
MNDEYDDTLENIIKAMEEHRAIDPFLNDAVGQSLRSAFAAIDDLIIFVNTAETKDRVCAERVMLGQLLSRCQTLSSFVQEPPKFKVIRNG